MPSYTRNIALFFIVLFYAPVLLAKSKDPVADFSFNNGKYDDAISHNKAKLVGTYYSDDRFGNENSAVFIAGNASSYINLGTYNALKPKQGSISLWVNIEHDMGSGMGALYNPLILTKCVQGNDYYEAYAIYYMLETKKLVALAVKDSTSEVQTYSRGTFKRNQWQHIVITYDNNYLCLYINGKQEGRIAKDFETCFLEGDSVMIGTTANKKNRRWLSGSIDDILFYDHVLNEEEISSLYHAPNPNTLKHILNVIGIIVIILTFSVVLYLLVRFFLLKKEKEQLLLTNRQLETELRVNRALMNPHFVFNSLNTLQNFIMSKDYLLANDYLLKFSKLMRKILENNMHSVISVEQEIDLANRYLEIENLRFEQSIQYTITVEPDLVPSILYIPVMMVQPFIENAVWHGLLKKEGKKTLTVSFALEGDKYLLCVIEDNGIGRRQEEQDTLKNKSLATLFILQRLEMLNKIHNLNCKLTIEDKPGRTGTVIKLLLPLLKK